MILRWLLFVAVLLASQVLHAQESPAEPGAQKAPLGLPLLPSGSSWSYLDDGKAPESMMWVRLNYDDKQWATGNAPLGYGDSDLATTLKSGPNPSDVAIAYFFRKRFVVPPEAKFDYVLLRIRRDDGAVIYLNGSEVVRTNMPLGPVALNSHAVNVIAGQEEGAYYVFPVGKSLLKPGENILAVQLHQRDGTSSDTCFDLELLGMEGFSFPPGTERPDGWYSNYFNARGAAAIKGTPLLVYLYGSRDIPSSKMNLETMNSRAVEVTLGRNFVRLHVDVSPLKDRSGLRAFNVRRLPVILVFDKANKEILRIEGPRTQQELLDELRSKGLLLVE